MGTAADLPIRLRDGLEIGRAVEGGILLADPAVSRRHARVVAGSGGWFIEDLSSRTGTFVNGKPVSSARLVVGDRVRVGPFCLRFDGRCLEWGRAGASIRAVGLEVTRGGQKLLSHAGIGISAGEFVGILGPSGAGKSTLLNILAGLRNADRGEVKIEGEPPARTAATVGFVPQDDIVHTALTVRRALHFAARLRLSRETPPRALSDLVATVVERVGLTAKIDLPTGSLSGGQRKRASVAAELVGCPDILFLDEPTSGLDPSAEFQLMGTLRDIASLGCTVLCTTHITANAHLFDRLVILSGGRIVFDGSPREARNYFQVTDFTEIYEKVRLAPAFAGPVPPPLPAVEVEARRPRTRPPFLRIIASRQAALIAAEPSSGILALGQPVVIAALVAWVSNDTPLALFFAYVATLWFGCGNAAQEIVKERALYLRESLSGLGPVSYLLGKFLVLASVTLLQAALLYLVLQVAEGGLQGVTTWQMVGLAGAALASTAMGLAISAASKSPLQAVMLVPLILIPQILFSGFVPPAGDFQQGPYVVSRAMPSAAAQSCMDTSLLWGRTISGALRVDYPSAFSNLNRDRSLKNGVVFQNVQRGMEGIGILAGWTVGSLGLAAAFLRRKTG
ncbi:MAG: hypothetical protein Fur0032_07050 [Terrimicrobiaceae bacterium]